MQVSLEQDEYWMRMALQQAELALQNDEVPVGAVVVRGDELVALGRNQMIGGNDPSAHAEVIALREAAHIEQNYRLPGTTLYVNLEPCAMCVGTIVHARVERVVFAAAEPKAGCLHSNTALIDSGHFNHQFDVTGAVLEAESAALISGFFAARRKKR